MKQTFLTRNDAVGAGTFDSIAWAFAEHVGTRDLGNYRSAVLYGNEDAPERIEFYLQDNPSVTDAPELIWHASATRADDEAEQEHAQ